MFEMRQLCCTTKIALCQIELFSFVFLVLFNVLCESFSWSAKSEVTNFNAGGDGLGEFLPAGLGAIPNIFFTVAGIILV